MEKQTNNKEYTKAILIDNRKNGKVEIDLYLTEVQKERLLLEFGKQKKTIFKINIIEEK